MRYHLILLGYKHGQFLWSLSFLVVKFDALSVWSFEIHETVQVLKNTGSNFFIEGIVRTHGEFEKLSTFFKLNF